MNINDFIKQNKELEVEEYKFLVGSFIYFICEATGKILYIGATAYPQFRFRTHSERIEFHNKPIYFFPCKLEECRELERRLIIKIKPKYNIQYIVDLKKKKRKTGPHTDTEARKESAEKIKKQIKEIMKEKKITQGMLAKKLGVSRQRANQIVSGNRGFHPKSIKKLRDALGYKLNIE